MNHLASSAVLLLCLTSFGGPVVAQKTPDFSGTWVEDVSQRKSPYPTTPVPGARAAAAPGVPIVITQTAAAIMIERRWMALVRFVYDLGGKQSVNHNGAETQTTSSRWEGAKLVTEGTGFSVTTAGESNWKFRQVRWLTAKGEMAVETTNTRDDDEPKTAFQVYRKKVG